MSFETSVGTSDADSITIMGRDLSNELLGKTTFTELAFLMVQRRAPSPDETRMLDAVLVSLFEATENQVFQDSRDSRIEGGDRFRVLVDDLFQDLERCLAAERPFARRDLVENNPEAEQI